MVANYVRKSYSGDFNYKSSIEIAKELAVVAYLYPQCGILLDLRNAIFSYDVMYKVMNIACEFMRLCPEFRNKLAQVIKEKTCEVSAIKQRR